jgi:hypothetical protein
MTSRAGGAIVAYRAVKRGADINHVVQATAASVNVGIAQDNQDTAERTVPIAHRPGELVTAEAGAAFAIDVRLASDANGRLVLAVTGNPVVAIAREAATALGDLVCVELVAAGTIAP